MLWNEADTDDDELLSDSELLEEDDEDEDVLEELELDELLVELLELLELNELDEDEELVEEDELLEELISHSVSYEMLWYENEQEHEQEHEQLEEDAIGLIPQIAHGYRPDIPCGPRNPRSNSPLDAYPYRSPRRDRAQMQRGCPRVCAECKGGTGRRSILVRNVLPVP